MEARRFTGKYVYFINNIHVYITLFIRGVTLLCDSRARANASKRITYVEKEEGKNEINVQNITSDENSEGNEKAAKQNQYFGQCTVVGENSHRNGGGGLIEIAPFVGPSDYLFALLRVSHCVPRPCASASALTTCIRLPLFAYEFSSATEEERV